MVKTFCLALWGVSFGYLWAQTEKPLILRLAPGDRARVLAALVALLILGFAMVLFARWAARATRRYMNRPIRHDRPPGVCEDDWAAKPLYQDDEAARRDSGDFRD
jgi:hypothetical protein